MNKKAAKRVEGDQLRMGLSDPVLRAMVRMVALLQSVPTDDDREMVVNFLSDWSERLKQQQEGVAFPLIDDDASAVEPSEDAP
jgi:hypothetical protein